MSSAPGLGAVIGFFQKFRTQVGSQFCLHANGLWHHDCLAAFLTVCGAAGSFGSCDNAAATGAHSLPARAKPPAASPAANMPLSELNTEADGYSSSTDRVQHTQSTCVQEGDMVFMLLSDVIHGSVHGLDGQNFQEVAFLTAFRALRDCVLSLRWQTTPLGGKGIVLIFSCLMFEPYGRTQH